MTVLKSTRRIAIFILIWFGQFVSSIGSGLTGFALGVWIYQRSGSVTHFTLISLVTVVPIVLVSPLAGALVDRWDRRWAMILSDSGSASSTLAIAVLLFTNRLEVWQIYLAIAIGSIFKAFQWPAFSATTTLLVPKKHLGRASGATVFGEAAAQIVSPTLAGFLMPSIQIQGIISIDFVTFLFALITLLCVRFPHPEKTARTAATRGSLWGEAIYGWNYIASRPGLLALLLFFAANNFVTGIVTVLVTPLVLAFAPVTVLGTILSVGGIGMLLGSLVASVWGTVKRPIYGVFGFSLLSGLCILFAGLNPAVPVFFCTAFLYFFGIPIVDACSQVIWQTKVVPEVQGRVFALRRTISWGALPLAYLVAGPLAEGVFEPLLAPGGLLVGSAGKAIGVGPGYGIAFLFVIMGTLSVLTSIGGYLYPRLRLVEDELPDAIGIASQPETEQI
jgi:MFS transporter, DHA3 family, macrolide efflux protein